MPSCLTMPRMEAARHLLRVLMGIAGVLLAAWVLDGASATVPARVFNSSGTAMTPSPVYAAVSESADAAEPASERRLSGYYTRCFTGAAEAFVQDFGSKAMQRLTFGDKVMVKSTHGHLTFEPVVGFFHRTAATQESFLVVSHSHGKLELSANHLLFVLGAAGHAVSKPAMWALVGETMQYVDAATGLLTNSSIVAIGADAGPVGMYAPVTESGTIVVNGVAASNYAGHPIAETVQHCAMHASMFAFRVYSALSSALRVGDYLRIKGPESRVHIAPVMPAK